VTGEMSFDPNCKNVVPMYLATVKNGKLVFRRASMEKPYASVRDRGAGYAGPPLGDLPSGTVRIGIFGPRAAELVSSEPLARAARDFGARYQLVPVSSDVPWNKASHDLVQLIYQPGTLGLIATDRASAHLAEQLAAKTFLPVLALSSDRSLTAVNLPWIFRLPPGTPLAEAVRCLLGAAEKAGPNRGKVRDLLASGAPFAGFRFDGTGEPR
jgi:phosphoribosylcarboxyaminoimidazole (NCAIR) mutase